MVFSTRSTGNGGCWGAVGMVDIEPVVRWPLGEHREGTGTRTITESSNNSFILVFSTRSIGSQKHNIVSRKGTVSTDGGSIDSEFVGGERLTADR
jgi:hypothetical protein